MSVSPTIITTPTGKQVKYINSIHQLPSQYQGVLLDQFGVLHDGLAPFSSAQSAVQHFTKSGSKTLILSNSSNRGPPTLTKLQRMGYDPKQFFGIVTSGDVAFDYLLNRPGNEWQTLGSQIVHFTWMGRTAISLDGLNLQPIDDVAECDFILAHGTDAIARGDGTNSACTVDDMKNILDAAARLPDPPPFVVVNPDVVTVSGKDIAVMPGTLASHYETLGCKVYRMGKPDPCIYDVAAKKLEMDKSKIIAVGDSLEHDVGGAAKEGIDQLLILNGIHAKYIDLKRHDSNGDGLATWLFDESKLFKLFDEYGVIPTYMMGQLCV